MQLHYLQDLWNDAETEGMDEPELLRYRSNLLGRDLRLTNFGGGNTSAKLPGHDPVSGETVEVLWVKGSGGDLGTIKRDGFATLYNGPYHRPASLVPGYRIRRRFGLNTGTIYCNFSAVELPVRFSLYPGGLCALFRYNVCTANEQLSPDFALHFLFSQHSASMMIDSGRLC